jgi:hypothetical protein
MKIHTMKYKKGNSDDIGIAGRKEERKNIRNIKYEMEIIDEKNNITRIRDIWHNQEHH